MTFALLAVVAIIWSLTVLRWSVSRKTSPWTKRAIVLSVVAGLIALTSAASDLHSIWLISSAPRSGVAITIDDNGEWWRLSYRRGARSFVTANEIHVPAGASVAMEWAGPPAVLWRAHDFLPQEMGRFGFVAERAAVDDIQVFRLWPPARRHLRIIAEPVAAFAHSSIAEAAPARDE